jgi:hypothetical protein
MNETLWTLAILVPEMIVLLWIYARAIGWQPRWRWELELSKKELEWRLDLLERRLELSEALKQAPNAGR